MANDVKLPLVYEKLPCLSNVNKTWKLDFIYSLVWPMQSPKPNCSGLMQTISKGSHPGKSSVTFLTMIDIDPTNMSCILPGANVSFEGPIFWHASWSSIINRYCRSWNGASALYRLPLAILHTSARAAFNWPSPC